MIGPPEDRLAREGTGRTRSGEPLQEEPRLIERHRAVSRKRPEVARMEREVLEEQALEWYGEAREVELLEAEIARLERRLASEASDSSRLRERLDRAEDALLSWMNAEEDAAAVKAFRRLRAALGEPGALESGAPFRAEMVQDIPSTEP